MRTTTNESSSQSLWNRFKIGINKWRLGFIVFALIYAFLVTLDLSKAAIQWDEVVHLNNGMYLLQGKYEQLSYFYPPFFDGVVMVFFGVLGVSVFSARLVSVIFSLLSLWAVFELTCKMYNEKIALIATILIGLFPGYFWLSRAAMIETMLVFFFTTALLLFYNWLLKPQKKMMILCGLTLGLGFLAKYQMIIVAVVMFTALIILAKDHLNRIISRFTRLILTAIAVIAPWIIISYTQYASGMLDNWIYALQMGNPAKLVYSERYLFPIFYFIEMTWPYNMVHPISILIYVIGLLGLCLFAWRRKREDKLLLTWFVVVYVFFTLIPNKHWRYVMPLFPVLAIAAASSIIFFYKNAKKTWVYTISVNKRRVAKIATALVTVLVALGVVVSIKDTYDIITEYQIQIDVEGATKYACEDLNQNESIMVLCPFNFFNQDMVQFYMCAEGTRKNNVCQYPELPVDSYTPIFNVTEFIFLCKQNNVKYVFTYEFGGTVSYYNTTLNLQQIYHELYDSGNFTHIADDATFGSNPRRIFVLTFKG